LLFKVFATSVAMHSTFFIGFVINQKQNAFAQVSQDFINTIKNTIFSENSKFITTTTPSNKCSPDKFQKVDIFLSN